ncbi:MAG TPA: C1 family peptidase [Candidatus Binatia bacterium]
MTPRKIARYGWVPDLPDYRDHLYAAPVARLAALPAKVNLRAQCPKVVYDQGQLGSCTANAIAAAIEFDLLKQKIAKPFTPSRLFIYYNERAMEGAVNEDSGAQIRDGVKSVNHLGAPPEALWPYSDQNPGPFQQKPPASVRTAAAKRKVTAYQRVACVLAQMKGCLAAGYPFVFGFTVYASFESPQVAKTGQVPMPGPKEGVLGGHAVLAVGYDDSVQRFIVRNSWGPKWGIKGYFTMPYTYLLEPNLADDFWTIRMVAD